MELYRWQSKNIVIVVYTMAGISKGWGACKLDNNLRVWRQLKIFEKWAVSTNELRKKCQEHILAVLPAQQETRVPSKDLNLFSTYIRALFSASPCSNICTLFSVFCVLAIVKFAQPERKVRTLVSAVTQWNVDKTKGARLLAGASTNLQVERVSAEKNCAQPFAQARWRPSWFFSSEG